MTTKVGLKQAMAAISFISGCVVENIPVYANADISGEIIADYTLYSDRQRRGREISAQITTELKTYKTKQYVSPVNEIIIGEI